MAETPNMVCPKCGHKSWLGELKATPGVEFSFLMGCVACGTVMDRMDALGQLEAGLREGEPENLREAVERGDFPLTIHASLPPTDSA